MSDARVPIVQHMRTIGFRSNILFAIAAAFGVIASLGRPWYAPSAIAKQQAVGELPSQMEDFFNGIGRAFSSSRRERPAGSRSRPRTR